MMNIQIRMKKENADTILAEAMECINRAAGGKPQWKKDNIYHCYETECDAAKKDIVPVFNELIAKYPALDIFALCSEDIREDDSSAQWWRTTKIMTKHHPDGTAELSTTSDTYWN